MNHKYKFLFILCFLFLTSGCYNYRELNNLAIATGLSIDIKDDDYVVNVLIANSKKSQVSSKEGEAQSIVYEGKGKTISSAIQEINQISPKQVYIGHLSFIVISEELAKTGIIDTLDYLLREPESIKRFYLIIATKTKAKDILEIVSPLESFPAQSVTTNISSSIETQAIASAKPYTNFIDKLLRKGDNPYLPTITIIGNIEEGKGEDTLKETTPKSYLKIGNLALFKKDKLVKYTSKEESFGINIIENDITELLLPCYCNGGQFSVSVTSLIAHKKALLEDQTPKINIQIKAIGYLQESNCKLNLKDEKVIYDLQEKAEKQIENFVEKGYLVAQKHKTDIFGFGNLFYKFYPKYFNSVEDKWDDEVFPNLKIQVDVNLSLKSKGSIESSIKEIPNE